MQIISPGSPVNTITVGGLCLPIAGLKILQAQFRNGPWCGFTDVSFGITPVAYTPSGSNKFYLRAGRFRAFSASADTIGIGLYSMDTALTPNAPAATNPLGMISGLAVSLDQNDWVTSQVRGTNADYQEFVTGGRIPNGKYGGMIQGNTAYGIMWLFGYEGA